MKNPLLKIPHDKALHAIGGVIVLILAMSRGVSFGIGRNIYIDLGLVLLAGVGGEVWDYFHKDEHTVDAWDIVATVSLAYVLIITLYFGGWYG